MVEIVLTTRKEEIVSAAIKILKAQPNGVNYSDLVRKISEQCPHIPINTVHGNVWDLETEYPTEIYKPVRGLYRHISFKEKETKEEETKAAVKSERIHEDMFYEPFADWLMNEAEDCTKAIALGKNKFRDKWGTPDVIGKWESLPSDIVKAPTEIISAEIKTDDRDLITAFGQACSYRLFSHKSYIVVPVNSPQDDVSRINSLCVIFGIGLVLFDNTNVDSPQFEMKVRPYRQEPDMFYVNKYVKLIEKELFR
jgi:hypothetical protein